MLYSKEVIIHATAWVTGNLKSKQWLQENNFEELVELKDAVSRYAKAFEYLLIHKKIVLAAFVNAVWNDKKAFELLMQQKAFHWAAMANFINGDDNAGTFLKKNGLAHYAEYAYQIQLKIRRDGDEGTNFFKSGPFKTSDRN